MEKPKFTQFQNEKGDYTIVYDLDGENERIVGYTGKRDVALNSCRELNAILFLERERKKEIETSEPQLQQADVIKSVCSCVEAKGEEIGWHQVRHCNRCDKVIE